MGMTEHDQVGFLAEDSFLERVSGKRRLTSSAGQCVRIDDVVEQDLQAGQADDLRLAIMKSRIVGVPGNGGDGRNRLQFRDQPGLANIAGMQYVLHAGKQFGDLRVEVIVGIGDDSYAAHETSRQVGRGAGFSSLRFGLRFIRSGPFFLGFAGGFSLFLARGFGSFIELHGADKQAGE